MQRDTIHTMAADKINALLGSGMDMEGIKTYLSIFQSSCQDIVKQVSLHTDAKRYRNLQIGVGTTTAMNTLRQEILAEAVRYILLGSDNIRKDIQFVQEHNVLDETDPKKIEFLAQSLIGYADQLRFDRCSWSYIKKIFFIFGWNAHTFSNQWLKVNKDSKLPAITENKANRFEANAR